MSAAAATLGGFLTALPWFDERLFLAAWVGMTLCIAVSSGQPPYLAFRLWLLSGLVMMATAIHWIPAVAASRLEVTLLSGFVVGALAITWDAFRFAVFGYLVAVIRPRGWWASLVPPTVWVALEWAWPHIFPWRLGHTQLGWLSLCQIGEAAGAYGVSFLLVWGAAAGGELLRAWYTGDAAARRLSIKPAATCALLLLVTVVSGWWRMGRIEQDAAGRPQLRLALVQPGARGEGMLPTLRARSREVAARADLILWPEASVGDFSTDLESFRSAEQVLAAARFGEDDEPPCPGLGRTLLCAGGSFEPGSKAAGPFYNTAFLIGPDGRILSSYHKRVLMPWGEYAVGQQWLPGLRGLLAGVDPMLPGDSAAPLVLPDGGCVGVLICYEDQMAPPARETVLEGAQVLLNLNNLSAFGRTAAAAQHQQLAMFRAIENRRYLVRCGTVGTSAVIDATGRVLQQAPTHKPYTLEASVPLLNSQTLYTRFGDAFAMLCLIATALLLCRRFAWRRATAQ